MIKKLYEKSEIWFAIAWIIAYVVLAYVGDNLSREAGVLKNITLPVYCCKNSKIKNFFYCNFPYKMV